MDVKPVYLFDEFCYAPDAILAYIRIRISPMGGTCKKSSQITVQIKHNLIKYFGYSLYPENNLSLLMHFSPETLLVK